MVIAGRAIVLTFIAVDDVPTTVPLAEIPRILQSTTSGASPPFLIALRILEVYASSRADVTSTLAFLLPRDRRSFFEEFTWVRAGCSLYSSGCPAMRKRAYLVRVLLAPMPWTSRDGPHARGSVPQRASITRAGASPRMKRQYKRGQDAENL